MTPTGIYRFDEADAELSLLPMAARRALDASGVHLSLRGWQRLPLAQRQALVTCGAEERVDSARVQACLAAVTDALRAEPPREVPAGPLPAVVAELLLPEHPLDDATWQKLCALDRYVLWQLASRGKRERVHVAYAEIVGA